MYRGQKLRLGSFAMFEPSLVFRTRRPRFTVSLAVPKPLLSIPSVRRIRESAKARFITNLAIRLNYLIYLRRATSKN